MRCVLTDTITGDLAINVNGESLLLDACGAAFVKDHCALVFADLHFGKGNAYARTRQFLPPYDTIDTLKRMAQAIARHKPAMVIALGDSFHDGNAAQNLAPQEIDLLQCLTQQSQFVWIAGNHDPHPPNWLGGEVAASLRLGGLTFRHAPICAFEPGEVAGHLHPCASVSKWGRSLRRRCFVSDGLRVILPSFGAYTGGLDVGHEAIASLFAGPFHAYMLGQGRVYAIPRRVAV
jgi:uncharacterized protein